jgi:Holliday junction resolvase RusA-like endonuclease
MVEQHELVHEAGRCGWDCTHPDHAPPNRIRFVLPSLPMSINSLYQIIYGQRKVELKPECRTWKTKAKAYVPTFKIADSSTIRLDVTFSFPWHHKNGKLRKFDSQNLLKLLIDAVSEKIGIDDSRIKSGSWSSVDSPDERVEVVLTEMEENSHANRD